MNVNINVAHPENKELAALRAELKNARNELGKAEGDLARARAHYENASQAYYYLLGQLDKK